MRNIHSNPYQVGKSGRLSHWEVNEETGESNTAIDLNPDDNC
jgi:hypothetical protein